MDACEHIYEVCRDHGIGVAGIPKTVDNDIAMTDHVPGYGSAARYLAATTQEVGEDVKSLPIHVSVIEAMGGMPDGSPQHQPLQDVRKVMHRI